MIFCGIATAVAIRVRPAPAHSSRSQRKRRRQSADGRSRSQIGVTSPLCGHEPTDRKGAATAAFSAGEGEALKSRLAHAKGRFELLSVSLRFSSLKLTNSPYGRP